ncbi:hypothetical protein CP533_2354 [Ophiocordyceps camponoti-saundersi (nom. inval.)]|nr:hypothetical protein CP533_2354 [Ophiocordyceps camponoti-saundersi (nom. inval.)]
MLGEYREDSEYERVTAWHLYQAELVFVAGAPQMLRRSIAGSAPCIRARAVAWTAEAMSSGHAIGLPWYIVIPLVAAGVNFTIRLPIHLYVSRLDQRRRQLRPLLAAWVARHTAVDADILHDESRLSGLMKLSQRRIFKEWRVQRWKSFLPLLSAGPFLVVTQALRGLCGAPTFTATSLFDQSLAHGGCLWFVDLTAQDPYYALPLLCSALIAHNTWGKLSKEDFQALLALNDTRPKSTMERLQLGLTRGMILFPFIAAASAYLPSAVFLYWATTFGLGSVNSAISKWRVFELDPSPHIPILQTRPVVCPHLPFLRGPPLESKSRTKPDPSKA